MTRCSTVWADDLRDGMRAGLMPLADPARAAAMADYFKGGPFLGVGVPARRTVQRAVWRALPEPDLAELLAGAAGLRAQPEREYLLAAIETLGHWRRVIPPDHLDAVVRDTMLDRPWWDTVDLTGSLLITPLVAAHPELVPVMWEWNHSGDQWLVRASIQHQRGLREQTNLPLLFDLCAAHTLDRNFWVAKAIGWALRDTARLDAAAVADFVAEHPDLSAVARREANRGISRATG